MLLAVPLPVIEMVAVKAVAVPFKQSVWVVEGETATDEGHLVAHALSVIQRLRKIENTTAFRNRVLYKS
jgi:hypothetical protein